MSIPITNQIKWQGSEKEKKFAKNFFTLNNWQYLVILGIAISGLAAFINTYDAISGINKKTQICAQSSLLQKELNTQFIVLIVLSCFAIVLGIILAWIFRSGTNQRKIVTLGIMTVGIFGIIYALAIKFYQFSISAKLGISWVAFLGFLILGYFISSGKKMSFIPESWGVKTGKPESIEMTEMQ